jgi:hypothetical protein
MPAETPLQVDMFTGALVDNRTAAQKQHDAALIIPRQMEMFSQRELAQYVPPPRMSLPDTATLMLVAEDPRTDEQREADREQAARSLTKSLFEDEAGTSDVEKDIDEDETSELTDTPLIEPETRRQSALAELEKVITDITQTLAATTDVLRAQSMWLALATVEAQTAGVDSATLVSMLKRLETSATKSIISEPLQRRESQPSKPQWGAVPPHVPQPMSYV